MVLLLGVACSGDDGAASTPGDVAAKSDVVSDLAPAGDSSGDGDELTAPPPCTPVEQGVLLPANSGTRKFALSLFHYNLQYVAGGLVGFLDRPGMDLTDIEVQDRIIVESFFPMVEILEEHPTWGMDAEMQGLMVEAIAERHAGMLPRIKDLVERGQLHIDSFHYSDQLWVAYPYPSMEHSFQFNSAAFARTCLPVGGAVFTQEGQFGHGMAHHIRASGRTALYPTNLFKYFSGDVPGALAYDWDGTTVVVAGKGVTEQVGGESVQVTWHFMNDGELAFTGNANPYFGSLFAYDEAFTKQYVEKLEQLEAEGWTIATVADYVAHLKEMGYQAEQMPLALDGAWQPKDTQNVLRWMGQVGELGGPEEDDNGVLTGNVKSRFMLQAVEAAIGPLELDAPSVSEALNEAWKHQLLAEVSDSTGWNPWPGEVAYSKDHSAAAAQAAWGQVEAAFAKRASIRVDTATGSAYEGSDEPLFRLLGPDVVELVLPAKAAVEPILDVAVEAPGREIESGWFDTGMPDVYLFRVALSAGSDKEHRLVRVTFPRTGDTLRYVPALLEEEQQVTEFTVTDLQLDDTQFLALGLANGLIELGDNVWVIKVETTVHLAAIVPKGVPHVRFENHTQPVGDASEWLFLVLDNLTAIEAADMANRINVLPIVELSIP